MPLTLKVTRGYTAVDGVPLDYDDLNAGFLPTIQVEGQIENADISNCAVTAEKCKPGAYWYVGTVGGSANAITLTTSCTLASLANGAIVRFKVATTNTSTVTLNVDSLGAKALRKAGDIALIGGELVQNMIVEAVYNTSYDSSSGAWQITSLTRADVQDRSGGSAPAPVQTYTSGSGNFTVPAGVYRIFVECIGGGGGGGWGTGEFGGGGGGYCFKAWNVTPGDSIAYSVGAGGLKATGGGAPGAGVGTATAGGNTTFNTTQIANGGAAGTTGAGGSYSGADYGFAGRPGTFDATNVGLSDRPQGGAAAYAGSLGSYALSSSTTEAARVGGGGCGDQDGADATHNGSDGAAGMIIIRW